MATGRGEALPRKSAEFVESSVLEALVPSDSIVNIEEELGAWDGIVKDEGGSILPFLTQRQVLLFDEIVPVYVVFRTPLIDDPTLNSYLARLAITLDAFIFSGAQPNEQEVKASPPKESVFSETIKDTKKPAIVRHGEGESGHIYILWKLDVFISRPRARFMKPVVYFQPSASLKPAERAKQDILDDEYLPSRVPTALNLLQSFEHDPALSGIHPRLSALRIGKIAPTAPVAKEMTRPIRSGQRPLFRVLPALIWRTRYSKVQASLSDLSLLAQLDMEVAHVTGCNITIGSVELSLSGGHIKAIAGHKASESESAYKPGDQLTYLYKIAPDVSPDGTPVYGSDGHFLTLKIKATVLLPAGCRPHISIEWKTGVDFTAEYNSDLIKAAHRMSNPALQVPVPKAPNPDALPSHDTENQDSDASFKTINVTLTISGPPQVKVGEMFQWEIFIVNRSDKIRKLAVLVIPKRKRDYERHRSHPSTSSIGGVRTEKKELLAHAIVDENVVYGKQKSARLDVAELICLTPDIRMGHLAPGACYTGEMKFLALSTGQLSVECVRVIDLATNETSDIRDLPNLVAIGAKE